MNTIHLTHVDSTNTYAKKNAEHFPKGEITCIVAEEQSAGRGREQKKWLSPKGVNLYLTFFFELSAHLPHLTAIGQMLAVSLARVILAHDVSPKLKWPNDIYLSGKKMAGILCETEFHGSAVDLFLGIGINVNMDDFSHIDQPATSLLKETNKTWDKTLLLEELQRQLTQDLEQFRKGGFLPFLDFFNERLAFKGQKVLCQQGAKTWEGICSRVNGSGQLEVELESGEIKTFSSGEISLRKERSSTE